MPQIACSPLAFLPLVMVQVLIFDPSAAQTASADITIVTGTHDLVSEDRVTHLAAWWLGVSVCWRHCLPRLRELGLGGTGERAYGDCGSDFRGTGATRAPLAWAMVHGC